MVNLLDKLGSMTDSLGRALNDSVSGLGFSKLVDAPQQQARDWTSLLSSGSGGVNWSTAARPTTQGLSWAQTALGGTGGGMNWSGLAAGRSTSGPFDLSGFDDLARVRADIEAQKRQDQSGDVGATGALLGSERWATDIGTAAGQYADAPELAEVAQAVMELESHGNANAVGKVVTSGPFAGQQAQGLMQIMPGNYPGVNLLDPATNIQKGLEMLYKAYKQWGNWDSAIAAYFGAIDGQGRPTTAADANGTTGVQYLATVNGYRQQIRTRRSAPNSGGGSMPSIWGGGNAPVTQGFGVVTPGIDQDIYGYGAAYGLPQGHTGVDIGLRRGTQLYSPLAGTVTTAGGTPYFRDEDYGDQGTPGKGELRITLDNGDIIILGHTSAINVQVGQRVTAGQLVGLSGSASGDHLHLEVRRRNRDGSYTLVNPLDYFGASGGTPQKAS